MSENEVETNIERTPREKVLVIKDAAGNMYLIPAVRISDALVSERQRSKVETELESNTAGEDYTLLGTYEMSIPMRRNAYAKPRVSQVWADVGTA